MAAAGVLTMPLPSTRVIDPRWAEHHRPTAHGTLTATCTITTGGGGDWDPTDGPTDGTPTTLYDAGPCRVQALDRSGGPDDAAGQAVAEHPYLVAIHADADAVPVGARVRIDTCPDDTQLAGLMLTVVETRYGSLRFERDLICDLDPANQQGG